MLCLGNNIVCILTVTLAISYAGKFLLKNEKNKTFIVKEAINDAPRKMKLNASADYGTPFEKVIVTKAKPDPCKKGGRSGKCPGPCKKRPGRSGKSGRSWICFHRDDTACMTTGGDLCVFPFKFEGITYHGCAKDTIYGTPWCSTKTDINHNHIEGIKAYGDCTADCPGMGSTKPTWLEICGGKFFYSKNKKSWQGAADYCKKYDGHLAQIDSVELNYCLLENFQNKRGYQHDWYWHSGNDKTNEGVWRHYDGNYVTLAMTWWNGDQPDGGTTENCLKVHLSKAEMAGKWGDDSCTRARYYICQNGPNPFWEVDHFEKGNGGRSGSG